MTQLVRFTPRPDLRRMQREFDRLFGNFFPAFGLADENVQTATWAPRLDAIETDDAFVFEFELPGVKKEDIRIALHDGVLTVSGERAVREVEENDNVVRVERFSGNFYRSFSIPTAIDEKKIDAKYAAGVLTLSLPKAEESKPRAIKIS